MADGAGCRAASRLALYFARLLDPHCIALTKKGNLVTLNEAAKLLSFRRDHVKIAIETGIELPTSKTLVRLTAHDLGGEYDIEEHDLDQFIQQFDNEDPGRHPPTAVRRHLLVEARHRCGIDGQPGPLEFHHMIEFARIKHYDVAQMIAICSNCHTRCTMGEIDEKAQRLYKQKLISGAYSDAAPIYDSFLDDAGPIRFSWDDLNDLISSFHDTIIGQNPTRASGYDYSSIDVEEKNALNNMGRDYYEVITAEYEPYFAEIGEFLGNPMNESVATSYYEIIDELRTKIAADRDKFDRFDAILVRLADAAIKKDPAKLKGKHRVLNVLTSFMYVNCDVGRKA